MPEQVVTSSRAKMAELMRQKIAAILDQSQKTFAGHPKLVIGLRVLYFKQRDVFRQEFLKHLNTVLVIAKREPAVERVVQFIVSFVASIAKIQKSKEDEADMEVDEEEQEDKEDDDSDEEEEDPERSPKRRKWSNSPISNKKSTSNKNKKKKDNSSKNGKTIEPEDEEDHDFCPYLLRYLLNLTEVKDKGVRFRSCQFLNLILQELDDIDNSLWDDIEEKMLTRIRDKVPLVRCQAVGALSRLQDPRNRRDVVLGEYLKLMREDSSKDVRKAVLNHIGISNYTMEDVLLRTRDVHEDVRKATYLTLAKKVPMEKLSTEQRILLLKAGLQDRNVGVQQACVKLLSTWLKRADSDIVMLLGFLKVEENEEIVELALKKLLPEIENEPDFDVENITNEKALYWRVYCQHLKHKKEEELEEILPDIADFCNIITVNRHQEFIMKQLLLMARLLDFSDEAGRRILSSLLCKLIPEPDISSDLRQTAMKLLLKVHSDESEFIRVVLEIISDLQDPLEADAHFEKEETRKKMWLQSLAITEILLENTSKNLKDGGIAGLLPSVILPGVQHTSPEVRNLAVKCLGLYCLLGLEEAKSHMMLLLQIIANDRDTIKLTAIKIVIDFIMTFGYSPFQDADLEELMDASQSQSSSQTDGPFKLEKESVVLRTLGTYLTYLNSDIRTTVVEGFAKLLFSDIIANPRTLSKLFVTFFDPITENDLRLRQCLSIFFPTYAFRSQLHRDNIERAFMMTLRAFMDAPKRSLLSQVAVSQVAQFLLHLLGGKEGHSNPYHDRLSIPMAYEILANPSSSESRGLCKVLGMLHITKHTPQDTIKTLRVLCGYMKDQIKDTSAVKHVEKFAKLLESLDQKPDKPLDADTLAEVKARLAQDAHHTSNEDKVDKYIKHQKDYFDDIDKFELNIIPPTKKIKVAPSVSKPVQHSQPTQPSQSKTTPQSTEKQLRERVLQLEAELARLKAQQQVQQQQPVAVVEQESTRKRKIRFEDEEQRPTITQKAQSTQEESFKKPAQKPEKPVQKAAQGQQPLNKPEKVPPAKVVKEKEPAKKRKQPGGETDEQSPLTQRTPPQKSKQEPATTAPPTKKRKMTEDKTKSNPTLEPLNQPLESEDSQPIPEISELVPNTPIQHADGETAAQTQYQRSKVAHVVVSFSGFKDNDPVFTTAFREDLMDRIQLLGGEVRDGGFFDKKITHVVSPPHCRTMKTLAASLTCRWLVSPQWVIESTRAGFFLDESSFGRRSKGTPFANQKFYITPAFRLENRDKGFQESNYKALIESLGRGKLIQDPDEADIVLIATEEDWSPYKHAHKFLNWNQFFDMIQPPPASL